MATGDKRPGTRAEENHVAPTLGPAAREEVARRAYEISLTSQGSTFEDNWRRAEEETRRHGSSRGRVGFNERGGTR